LFDVPYDELLPKLWAFVEKMGLSITLSTEVKIGEEILPVGTRFTQELVDHLVAGGIDAMLENGEGHTLVLPKAL
jgi:diphthamide synthase (EF-2-diphthine--ammonia ligase)